MTTCQYSSFHAGIYSSCITPEQLLHCKHTTSVVNYLQLNSCRLFVPKSSNYNLPHHNTRAGTCRACSAYGIITNCILEPIKLPKTAFLYSLVEFHLAIRPLFIVTYWQTSFANFLIFCTHNLGQPRPTSAVTCHRAKLIRKPS